MNKIMICKLLISIVIYILFLTLYITLYMRVKRNICCYDNIPNETKYKKSVFYIGNYDTSYDQRSRRSIREGVFYLITISICFCFLAGIFIVMNAVYLYISISSKNSIGHGMTGIPIMMLPLLFLSVAYSNTFLFMKNSFTISVCLCQTWITRGRLLKRRMLMCVIFTVVLMPFVLLGLDNYAYVTDSGIYVNPYFSLQEEEYLFSEIENIRMEKRYDDAGYISAFQCYIETETGKKINIFDIDLDLNTIKFIFNNEKIKSIEATGDIAIKEEEAEIILDEEASYTEKEVKEWILYHYLGIE